MVTTIYRNKYIECTSEVKAAAKDFDNKLRVGKMCKTLDPIGVKIFLYLRNSEEQKERVRAIRQLLAEGVEKKDQRITEQKTKLLQVFPCCQPDPEGAFPVLVDAMPREDIRIYDLDRPDGQAWSEREPWAKGVVDAVMQNKNSLRVLFFYETATGGFHLWCAPIEGLKQAEQTARTAAIVGTKVDPACKDHHRCLFQTPNEYIKYIDEDRFVSGADIAWGEPEHEEPDWSEFLEPVAKTKKSKTKAAKKVKTKKVEDEEEAEADEEWNDMLQEEMSAGDAERWTFTPEGIAGLSIEDFLELYWRLFNGGQVPQIGERHNKLWLMAKAIAPACKNNVELMKMVVPNLFTDEGAAGEQEWQQIISDACALRRQVMTSQMAKCVKEGRLYAVLRACGGTLTRPPMMPRRLPDLVAHAIKNTPLIYQPAVANAIFAPLGATLHDVRFKYIDNKEEEAHFISMTLGTMSAGKSCINQPCEELTHIMKLHDEDDRQKLEEWAAKQAEEPKTVIPKPAVCERYVSPDFTRASLNQFFINAEKAGNYYLYCLESELENCLDLVGGGGNQWAQFHKLLRNLFDNQKVGQHRVTEGAVKGRAKARLNLNFATVITTAKRQFGGTILKEGRPNQLINGTTSRFDMGYVPESRELPIYGEYTSEWRHTLWSYLTLLDQCKGLIESSEAANFQRKLMEKWSANVDKTGSGAYFLFGKRHLHIAFLKGMILYIANNYKWCKQIAEFVEWSFHYGLWVKMRFFGEDMEYLYRKDKQLEGKPADIKRAVPSLLDFLPNQFVEKDYFDMRKAHPELCNSNKDPKGLLRTWKKRGLLEYDDVAEMYVKKR